jgi:chemotaxis protein MotD
MTVSVRSLPGFASPRAHAGPPQADAGQGRAFGDILNAAKPPHGKKSAHAEKPHDTAAHPSRWAEFAGRLPESPVAGKAAGPAGAEVDETVPGPASAKSAPEKASGDGKPERDGKKDPEIDAVTPQDKLLLPAVPQDPHVAAATGRSAAPDDGDGPGDQSQPAPGKMPSAPATPAILTEPTTLQLRSPAASAIAGVTEIETPAQQGLPAKGAEKGTDPIGTNLAARQAVGNAPPAALPATAAADVMSGQAGRPAFGAGPASVHAASGFSVAQSGRDRQPDALERVSVVADRSFPAPAPLPVSRAAADLVGAIASDNGWRQAPATTTGPGQPGHSVAVAAHTLKIELHPAELGVVTASLRFAAGQLSIELRPETHEGHRRLSSDTDAIVKSLRGLGLDVDTVTLMQPQVAATGSARPDAGGTPAGSPGRDQPSLQSGSGGNGDGSGSQQPGRNRNDDGQQNSGRAAAPHRERARGDLYI